jgi:hypothetical protein
MGHQPEAFKAHTDHQTPSTSAELAELASLIESGHDWSLAIKAAKITPQHLTWLFHHACGCRPPSAFFEELLRHGQRDQAVALLRDAERLLLTGEKP